MKTLGKLVVQWLEWSEVLITCHLNEPGKLARETKVGEIRYWRGMWMAFLEDGENIGSFTSCRRAKNAIMKRLGAEELDID